MGDPLDSLFGGGGGDTGGLRNMATADWNSPDIQRYLPDVLRNANINPALFGGMAGISNLLRNPGSLSPTVADAVRPQVAQESQQIAQNFRNMGMQQAGTAARSGMPVSLQGALNSALDIAHARAQRGAQQGALGQSAQLQRSDLDNFFKLLDMMHTYGSTGRGQAIQAYGGASGDDAKKQAAKMAMMAAMIGAFASNSRFKKNFELVEENDILKAIDSLPVYEWSYKGQTSRHIGPMAEEFRETFGTGDSPDVIHFSDAVGTLMAATQALARKVKRLEAQV